MVFKWMAGYIAKIYKIGWSQNVSMKLKKGLKLAQPLNF